MQRTILLFFALVLFAAAPVPQDSEPQSEDTCLTCEGKGAVKLECTVCDGRGKAACIECTSILIATYTAELIALHTHLNPDEAEKLRETSLKANEAMSQLEGLFGSREPGTKRCPANCANGKSFLGGVDCKACSKKGGIKCGHCKGKSEATCFACDGHRKPLTCCPECMGSGKSKGLPAGDAYAWGCPWCEDVVIRACHGCEQGKVHRHCRTCAGSGERICASCSGCRKSACSKCRGTGLIMPGLLSGDRPKKCEPCKGKGVQRCSGCKNGKVECRPCKGAGEGELQCLTCHGERKAPCAGCTRGDSHAWVVTARRLTAVDRGEQGLKYYEVAWSREEERIRARLKELGLEEKAAKSQEKVLRKEIAWLQTEIEEARKAVEKAGK